jgi:hypothetical protein
MNLIPLIIILTSFLFPTFNALLSIATYLKDKRIYITLFTGVPEQTISTSINMDKPYSLFTSDTFNPQKSSTSKHIQSQTIEESENKFDVEVYEDNFKFAYVKASNNNYKYYHLSNPNETESTIMTKHYGLSLAYKSLNDEYSFIRHLYKNKFINIQTFAFKQYTVPPNTYLYFGTIPDKIIENSQIKGMCKILPRYTTWGCNLNSVVMNGFNWNFNKYVSFRINKSEYVFGCPLHNLILYNYLQSYLKDNRCKDVFKGKNKHKKYCECDKEIVDNELNKKMIGFSFGNFVKYVKLNTMFNCKDGEKQCLSLFKCVENQDEYIFNKDFILSSVTVFDYDKGSVEFYNEDDGSLKVVKNGIKGREEDNNSREGVMLRKGICFVNSVMMSYMILELCIRKFLK